MTLSHRVNKVLIAAMLTAFLLAAALPALPPVPLARAQVRVRIIAALRIDLAAPPPGVRVRAGLIEFE